MHSFRRPLLRPRVLGLLLLTLAPSLHSQTGEAALKAAFLHNFALYTEWPALGEHFDICVIGKNSAGEAIDNLARKEVSGRPVRITRLESTQLPGTCNIVFIPAPASESPAKVLASLNGKPILTVTDGKPTDNAKPMLALSSEQGRLVFDANQTVARSAGLTFSAKLLRLARSVN